MDRKHCLQIFWEFLGLMTAARASLQTSQKVGGIFDRDCGKPKYGRVFKYSRRTRTCGENWGARLLFLMLHRSDRLEFVTILRTKHNLMNPSSSHLQSTRSNAFHIASGIEVHADPFFHLSTQRATTAHPITLFSQTLSALFPPRA